MKLSTLLAATVSAANIDRRVDIDVKTGELTEYRSESGRFLPQLNLTLVVINMVWLRPTEYYNSTETNISWFNLRSTRHEFSNLHNK